MGLMQKDIKTSRAPRIAKPHKAKKTKSVDPVSVTNDADAQDAALWDLEISGSLDVLHTLAAEALANYDAGRTKKISG